MATLWSYLVMAAGVIGILFAVTLRILKAGKDDQKVRDYETQEKSSADVDSRLNKAVQADTVVRNDAADGGLRKDDGHKRH
jgi:hypothetical protein